MKKVYNEVTKSYLASVTWDMTQGLPTVMEERDAVEVIPEEASRISYLLNCMEGSICWKAI